MYESVACVRVRAEMSEPELRRTSNGMGLSRVLTRAARVRNPGSSHVHDGYE